MRPNPGNAPTLRKRLIQQIFAETAERFQALDEGRPLIDQTERLAALMNAGGSEAGQRFEPRVRLDGGARCEVVTHDPVSVPDVLASILRAGLHYVETLPDPADGIAIRLHGYEVPVVVARPVLDILESA